MKCLQDNHQCSLFSSLCSRSHFMITERNIVLSCMSLTGATSVKPTSVLVDEYIRTTETHMAHPVQYSCISSLRPNSFEFWLPRLSPVPCLIRWDCSIFIFSNDQCLTPLQWISSGEASAARVNHKEWAALYDWIHYMHDNSCRSFHVQVCRTQLIDSGRIYKKTCVNSVK